MKKFEKPDMQILEFFADDVIVTSISPVDPGDENPETPIIKF